MNEVVRFIIIAVVVAFAAIAVFGAEPLTETEKVELAAARIRVMSMETAMLRRVLGIQEEGKRVEDDRKRLEEANAELQEMLGKLAEEKDAKGCSIDADGSWTNCPKEEK